MAVGTHALKGLFSIICIPALLVICLLGLKVQRGVLGGHMPYLGPQDKAPYAQTPSLWGTLVEKASFP